jgi:hypothetical protein
MNYKIALKDGKRFVYLNSDPPQYLDEKDVAAWMRETRDDHPDLYAKLVHAYVLLTKSSFQAPNT